MIDINGQEQPVYAMDGDTLKCFQRALPLTAERCARAKLFRVEEHMQVMSLAEQDAYDLLHGLRNQWLSRRLLRGAP